MESPPLFGICQIDDFMVLFVDLIRVSDMNFLSSDLADITTK